MLLSTFCTNCGTEFEEAAKFCVECGQRRSEVALPPQEITTLLPEPQIESPELHTDSTQNLGSVDAVVEKQAAKSFLGPIEFLSLTALLFFLIYVVATVAFSNNA